MRFWFSYWQENLGSSLGLWNQDRKRIIFLSWLMVGIPAISLAYGLFRSFLVPIEFAVIAGIGFWLSVLLFIVTPMRMWKRQVTYLAQLTTPRLTISIDSSLQHIGSGMFSQWLSVINESSQTIHRCYGRIKSFQRIYPSHSSARLPRQGHELPWARQSGWSGFTTDISGFQGLAHLNVAMVMTSTDEFLRIPCRPSADDGTPDFESYVLLPGAYDVVVEVGSMTESFKPTTIHIRITFGGGTDITAARILSE